MPRDLTPGFFDDLSILPPKPTPVRRQPSQAARAAGTPRLPAVGDAPCDKCPLNDGRPKIPPTRPAHPRLQVIGLGPSREEVERGEHLVGPGGQMLRAAIRDAGLDDVADVEYLNLTRCRPDGDDFDSSQWESAAKRCRRFLHQDLAGGLPLLALGTKPLQVLSGDSKLRISGYHGLWVASQQGYRLFAARHPAGILRLQGDARVDAQEEFTREVRTCLETLTPESQPARAVPCYRTPEEAHAVLTWLAAHPHPWAFDIESFDAGEFPSRKWVSTDPCHPDFRLRGIAIAVSSTKGFWVDLMDYHDRKDAWRPLLAPCFGSPAEKWAFSGHFDEEALVYPGWVPRVARRWGDGMLGLVSLGDGTHESLRLERAVVDLLQRPQYWGGLDKSRMRDAPIEQVAAGAVEDAMATFALCVHLHARMTRGEYL